jgi:hypothetical protein
MNKVILFAILLLSISTYSCENEDPTSLFSGETNNLYFVNLEPDIEVNYIKPSYSLDVNNDSIIDITFLQLRVATSTGFTTIPAVINLDNYQFLISESDDLPAALEFNEHIDLKNIWSNINDTLFLLIDYKKGPGGAYTPYGDWLNVDDKYLGIKCDKRMGWIKMSNYYILPQTKIVIKEFAFQN